jgi:hypothetical protein
MNVKVKFILGLVTVGLLAGLVGCSKVDKDEAATTPPKVDEKPGVTVDRETQERIGLKTETPVAAQWQPQIQAVGTVMDPLGFMAAVTDYASARAAADLSRRELERTQKLADQNNASARMLETAQAAATHDLLALKAAEATFAINWGANLAARTDLVEFAQALATNDTALVKLSLPVGTILHPAPAAATVFLLEDETNPAAASLVDELGIDPAAQTETLLFATARKLPQGAAVTATMDIAGEPVNGVRVPFSAVLRHEGAGWVYVQTDTNQFVRLEIPLDRLQENGWFVSENLSVTNEVIVSGAQTVLSAELGVSAGGDSD